MSTHPIDESLPGSTLFGDGGARKTFTFPDPVAVKANKTILPSTLGTAYYKRDGLLVPIESPTTFDVNTMLFGRDGEAVVFDHILVYPKIIVHSGKASCVNCKVLKDMLSEEGITFTEVEHKEETEEGRQDRIAILSQFGGGDYKGLSFPRVTVDGVHLEGNKMHVIFDRIEDLWEDTPIAT